MGAGDRKTDASQPNPAAAAKAADTAKAQRRAEALRANLRRRKTQQRDRAEIGKAPDDHEE